MISFTQTLQELGWTEAEWEQRQREARARTWQNQQRSRLRRRAQQLRAERLTSEPFNGIRGIGEVKL